MRELPEGEVQHLPEFDGHEHVYELRDESAGLHGFIAIHRKHSDLPSLGATRLWPYETPTDALRDALRLARLMTSKSASAGMSYGGAKAALILPREIDRGKFFASYAKLVTELRGAFVTGTDVGLDERDLSVMAANSPYMIGSGVDAGLYTAQGVLYGIEAALEFLDGAGAVAGKRFAIQGLGKTGGHLLRLLVNGGVKDIVVSDIAPEPIAAARKIAPDFTVVPPEEIHKQRVDVFCPCALSGVINPETVQEVSARAVVGSANNQLASADMADALFHRGIVYVPDYMVNAGGFISVIDQYEHATHDHGRLMERLQALQQRIRQYLLERGRPAPVATPEELAVRVHIS